jgi:hypothetical protein
MAERGFTTKGAKDSPGGGYKRNFNRNPTGRFNVKMQRGKSSRSKSRG